MSRFTFLHFWSFRASETCPVVRPLCCPGCAGRRARSPAGVPPIIGLAVQVASSHALGFATAWGVFPLSLVHAFKKYLFTYLRCPCGSDGKESSCNAGDLSSIPGLERSPGEGNGYPLQYSGLENSMDRGAWQATVHGVTKSGTQLNELSL